MTLEELSQQQEVSFGTSGVRALVTNLSPNINYAYASAFISKVCPTAKKVAIGIDLRPSSPSIANAMILAAEDLQVEVIYCGALPTPALAYFAMEQGIPAIMVTGSHIPFDRNGFKFYTPKGEITKADEQAILSSHLQTPAPVLGRSAQEHQINPIALEQFKQRYTSVFPNNFLKNKRIGVYEHSSVARDTIKELLTHFGAEVISLDRTDTFVPIDTEAVSREDQEKAIHWSEQHHLDAILSTDGDGDRPLISDEHGQWLRGDIVGILVSQYLNATHVSCPINANTALELSNPELITNRTKIGSPYVIEGMEQLAQQEKSAKVVGYEANGGFLTGTDFNVNGAYLKSLPTRDSILPMLAIFAAAAEQGIPLSQLVSLLPQRYTASDRIQNVNPAHSKRSISNLKESQELQTKLLGLLNYKESTQLKSIDETDGLRMTFSNDNMIIHLRPSGNAPELRCYCETSDQSTSNTVVKTFLQKASQLGF